jgi:hypothetical protein
MTEDLLEGDSLLFLSACLLVPFVALLRKLLEKQTQVGTFTSPSLRRIKAMSADVVSSRQPLNWHRLFCSRATIHLLSPSFHFSTASSNFFASSSWPPLPLGLLPRVIATK